MNSTHQEAHEVGFHNLWNSFSFSTGGFRKYETTFHENCIPVSFLLCGIQFPRMWKNILGFGPAVRTCHVLGPAVRTCHVLGPAVRTCHVLGPAVRACHVLWPAVRNCRALGPAVRTCHVLGPAVRTCCVLGPIWTCCKNWTYMY